MGNFEAATAVTPRKGTELTFDAVLDPEWAVGTKLHGGYLLAVLGRAAAHVADDRHPHLTAVSAAFIEAPQPEPATVEVELLRTGRGSSQLRARLVQNDRPCVEALITQGLLEEADPWWSSAQSAPVDLPAEQECLLSPVQAPGAAFPVPLMGVVETRLDPGTLGFAFGKPTGTGRIASWQRLADGTDWDPLSLLVALDPVPPVSFDLGLTGWVPTIQLSAYIRRLPVPGPVRVNMQATDVGGDRMDEQAHAWDSKNRLVAQATQIAGVRIPT